MKSRILAALVASALAGCSSTVENAHEQIKVYTHPGSADCALSRQGKVIGRIAGTPGFTTITRGWYDITIRCSKDGYKDAVYRIRGSASGIFFDKPPPRGRGTDDADSVNAYGALYDVVVSLTLRPISASAPAGAPAPTSVPLSGTISILGQ